MRHSTDLRRRNYNNRGLIRHHFVDNPCRIMPDGTLYAYVMRTLKRGSLYTSFDNGFVWNTMRRSDGSNDIFYGLSPRSVIGLDIQGPIIFVEPHPDNENAMIFTGHSVPPATYVQSFQGVNLHTGVADDAVFPQNLIVTDNALEGVFGVSGYQHWFAIGYVEAITKEFGVKRFSPYDGSRTAPVYESSFDWVNRYYMLADGETGFCDIVVQSTIGAGPGSTMPVIKDWGSYWWGGNYDSATTVALTFGGSDYNFSFNSAEQKHCVYLAEIEIPTPGTMKPTMRYHPERGEYLFENTMVVYGGVGYGQLWDEPGYPADTSYTMFWAYAVGGTGNAYGASRRSASLKGYHEPNLLSPDAGDSHVTGVANVHMMLVSDSISGRRHCILVSSTRLASLQAWYASYGFGKTIDVIIYDVYIANGAGNDYTFNEAALTAAGATLAGGDGDWGERGLADIHINIGAPSASANPEPQPLWEASLPDFGIQGYYDVDIILASRGGSYFTFAVWTMGRFLMVAQLTAAGYSIDLVIPSAFTSNGSENDYTFNMGAITGAGATLWGGDGCGGERTPGGNPADVALRHFRFNFFDGAFGPVTEISPVAVLSVALARDGNGTLCAVWGEMDGLDVRVRYALSHDNGLTWFNVSPVMGGASAYTDSITGDPEARVDVIGGEDGGFLFMYVRKNSAGVPRLYIHRITASPYTCGEAKEASNLPVTEPIVGGRFFKPLEDYRVNLGIPGFVRIAYQIGEGNSEGMLDSIPVRYAQNLLLHAYPTGAVGAATSINQDYYALGMTGTRTTEYERAFATLGTTCTLRRYEPLAYSTMGDRSSYGEAVQVDRRVILDPSTYAFPSPEIDAVSQEAWIERDSRRLFLPPNTPMLRSFVLNAGNHLKRTVWTILLAGNEYEISQVVPRFLDDQICFYEANAYVIGPSRDPWARIVLPSET